MRYAVSDMGRDWNPNKTVQIAFRVPVAEKAQAELFARESGYHSLSDWIRTLMREDIAKSGQSRKKGNQGR